MICKKLKKTSIDKKKPSKTIKLKNASNKEREYKDLELETLKSTRDNFLVWKDFSSSQ